MTNAQPLANSLHRATLDALRQHAPFAAMPEEDVLWLVRRLSVAYYAAGETLLAPADEAPGTLFIIKQGTVGGASAEGQTVLQLTAGEMFPLGALLAGRGVANRYVAETDTFCHLLPAAQVERSAIWDGCLVERGAIIRDSIVGYNCYIGAGALIDNAVLGDGTIVASGARWTPHTNHSAQ